MSIIKHTLIIFIFLLKFTCIIKSIDNKSKNEYALVAKPVVDVIGEPLPDLSLYNNISFSPINKRDGLSCPRFHQLLFNEVVKIVEKQGDELIIELPSVFFQKLESSTKNNKFRTLKKNLVLFSHLEKFNIDFEKFPKQIDYDQPKDLTFDKTITLKGPFTDYKTQKIYSAGTRFVYSHEDDKNYHVYIFNSPNHHFVISPISKKLCINSQDSTDKNKKIANFVKLVKKWAHLKKGFIPYVWGGCSLCTTHNEDTFVDVKRHLHKKTIHYYHYPSYNQNQKTGFDCSGMILRAAQICGLPYYFKNSTTTAQNLEQITQNDTISNGDIIWIPGHVIVISDVKSNLMVEATDYSTGYGKVHEIEISKIFKNINTYDDLKSALLEKKPLKRLNKQGKIFQEIPIFKILKIKSLWSKA